MYSFSDLYKRASNGIHHAYLITGDPEEAEKFLHGFFEGLGFRLLGSPDFFVYKEPLFGVDLARELTFKAELRAFTKKKVFFIAPERITAEAQNALLKTFEDPIPDTHFFLAVRGEEIILPTLRSRMQQFDVGEEFSGKGAERFLNFPLKERLDFIRKFVEKDLNLSVFLDELLVLLRREKSPASVEKVYKARLLSSDRAASPRLILEHLALVL